MPISSDGNRLPCTRCGKRLYFHEAAQDLCKPCAGELGIERICDRPWGPTRVKIKAGDERTPMTIYLEET